MTRYVREEPCEHGRTNKHISEHDPAGNTWCKAPIRTVLDFEEMVESANTKFWQIYSDANYEASRGREDNADSLLDGAMRAALRAALEMEDE